MAGLTCDCFHGGKIKEFSLVKPNKGPGIIKCCSKVIMGVINCVDIWRSNFLRHTVQGENFAPVGKQLKAHLLAFSQGSSSLDGGD